METSTWATSPRSAGPLRSAAPGRRLQDCLFTDPAGILGRRAMSATHPWATTPWRTLLPGVLASCNEAIESRRALDSGRFRWLLLLYEIGLNAALYPTMGRAAVTFEPSGFGGATGRGRGARSAAQRSAPLRSLGAATGKMSIGFGSGALYGSRLAALRSRASVRQNRVIQVTQGDGDAALAVLPERER